MDVPTQQAYENLLGLQKKRSNLSRLSRYKIWVHKLNYFIDKEKFPLLQNIIGGFTV
jgi:hypothetical protein